MSGDDQRPSPDLPEEAPSRAQQTPGRAHLATEKGPPLTHLKEGSEVDPEAPPRRTRRRTSPIDDSNTLPAAPPTADAPAQPAVNPPPTEKSPTKGVDPLLLGLGALFVVLMGAGCLLGMFVTLFLFF